MNYLDTLLTTPFCDKWDLQGVLAKGSVFDTLSSLYNAHVAALTQGMGASAAAEQSVALAAGHVLLQPGPLVMM